jgi:nucleoside-diphosphate-sugar epimerase
MIVTITGGMGYLGGELTKLLVMDSSIKKINIIDKGVYGMSHLSSLIDSKINLLIKDIRDKSAIASAITESDVIVHLASLVGAPLVDRKPIEAYETNIQGTKCITDLVGPSQRFIFASTGSSYGKVDGICTEKSTKISPLSSYGKHKAEGEAIVKDKNGISLRFATVYGLSFRTRDDLYIHSMIQKALIDRSVVLYQGDASRTFMHVNDAARAVRHFINISDLPYDIFNVGDPDLSYTKREICNLISRYTPFTISENSYATDIDQRDYVVSYDRIIGTGFKCEKVLNSEIEVIMAYYTARFNCGYLNG